MKPIDGRHLRDDQMIAVCLGTDPPGPRRERALAHMDECLMCTSRYDAIAGRIETLRDEACAEADAIFTPARLEVQRAQIMARLEHVGHHARVLKFPARSAQPMSIFTGSQVRRWIAAAAAAGLIIGVTVGRMADFRPTASPQPSHRVASGYVGPTPPAPVAHIARPTDDELLSNIERPLYLQPIDELEALDAMTPQPHQIALRLR